MTFTNQIGSYQLLYFGKRSDNQRAIAQINLENESSQYIGTVYFYRDGQIMPNNSSIESSSPRLAYLNLHERQLDSVVDMLRNEKPCGVHYQNLVFGFLYTGKEPLGEEESEE